MPSTDNIPRQFSFEEIYTDYSAPLYGMILKICQNNFEAEEILIQSFRCFIQQNLLAVNTTDIFLNLMRITIPIAAEKTSLSQQHIGKIIFKELVRTSSPSNAANVFLNQKM